jgi:hypothetical protein
MRWRKKPPSANEGGKSHVFGSPTLFAPTGIKKSSAMKEEKSRRTK